MKGLNKYLQKHGRHFTEELALKASDRKWNAKKIDKAAQRRVYYNVTNSTLGDMVYLTDTAYSRKASFSNSIRDMLKWIGNYQMEGSAFNLWLTMLFYEKKDFDFTPYI